uniref:N-alpha-acetyltransferase 38, NatC auxiliary subunit n=1 Tax=Agelaius phoeniceus TaxID=39638 RepID=UPI0023EDA69E|nr:N-alpha-acetyltransferase 38, NatC auxiliary subunit [Agelaius phoeniceus]
MADPPEEAGAGPAGRDRGVAGPPRGRQRLEALLNRSLRIRMSDGRTLVGAFLCTDRQSNVILGSAQEFLKAADAFPGSEPRVLGLAMVPGHHIVSIEVEPPYP